MKKSLRAGLSRNGAGFPGAGALRPGVEAAMLAAVAFGCAQAGWSLVGPGPALGSIGASAEDGAQEPSLIALPDDDALVSPFAPNAASLPGASNAAAAYIATVQLAGVRLSENPARSGAILTLQDGAQRAYLVGQELSAGIVLAEVTPDGVVVRFEGGERLLPLAAPARGASFADALMGRANLTLATEAPPAAARAGDALTPFDVETSVVEAVTPLITVAPSTFAESLDASAIASPFEAAPEGTPLQNAPEVAPTADALRLGALLETLGAVRTDEGFVLGASLPPLALVHGLRPGDVVVAINGVPAAEAVARMDRVQGDIAISVRRGDRIVVLAHASPLGPA